jgi:hypothetical protein
MPVAIGSAPSVAAIVTRSLIKTGPMRCGLLDVACAGGALLPLPPQAPTRSTLPITPTTAPRTPTTSTRGGDIVESVVLGQGVGKTVAEQPLGCLGTGSVERYVP